MKTIDFDEYQHRATKTAIYPGVGTYAIPDPEGGNGLEPLAYLALGLTGEAGEVADKVKKAIRDGIKDEQAWSKAVAKELGDVLWYVSQIARELGYQFADIAGGNLTKLEDRQQRSALGGSGDDR